MISAIASPIAVQAGVEALRQGGSAADAAATTALTEIATQLGSVVSYAGIMTLVYYDARADKVYSLDAGYNSYLGESEPMTIPGRPGSSEWSRRGDANQGRPRELAGR